MTQSAAITSYCSLSKEQQIALLTDYAHEVTIIGRGTYVPGTEELADPRRLRMLNELQHRITGHIRQILTNNAERYPDDVIIHIIVPEADTELLAGFEAVLRRHAQTS